MGLFRHGGIRSINQLGRSLCQTPYGKLDPWNGRLTYDSLTQYQSEPEGPDKVVTEFTPKIVWEYQRNEVAADQRFKIKLVAVKGEVVRVGKNVQGVSYVTLCGDEYTAVQCFFDPRDTDQVTELAQLEPMRRVVILGIGEGKGNNVIFGHCKIYAKSKPYSTSAN
jgi:hypothetical protein